MTPAKTTPHTPNKLHPFLLILPKNRAEQLEKTAFRSLLIGSITAVAMIAITTVLYAHALAIITLPVITVTSLILLSIPLMFLLDRYLSQWGVDRQLAKIERNIEKTTINQNIISNFIQTTEIEKPTNIDEEIYGFAIARYQYFSQKATNEDNLLKQTNNEIEKIIRMNMVLCHTIRAAEILQILKNPEITLPIDAFLNVGNVTQYLNTLHPNLNANQIKEAYNNPSTMRKVLFDEPLIDL